VLITATTTVQNYHSVKPHLTVRQFDRLHHMATEYHIMQHHRQSNN